MAVQQRVFFEQHHELWGRFIAMLNAGEKQMEFFQSLTDTEVGELMLCLAYIEQAAELATTSLTYIALKRGLLTKTFTELGVDLT